MIPPRAVIVYNVISARQIINNRNYVYDLLKLLKTYSMIKKCYNSIILISTVTVLLSLGSCDPAKKYEKAETEAITNYLNSNPTDTFKLESDGLYYLDVLDGTGRSPVLHDTAHIVIPENSLMDSI